MQTKPNALHDKDVVHSNDVNVLDTLVLELQVVFHVSGNLTSARPCERTRNTNLQSVTIIRTPSCLT